MKKVILLSATLIFALFANAQIVNIPDTNFKAALVSNLAINTNADNEIQVSEATAYKDSIFLDSLGITDITGIEAFTALTGLNTGNNLLQVIDVSYNTELRMLRIEWAAISSIDLSNNTALIVLELDSYILDTVDISNNIALEELSLSGGNVTSFDLSNNTALTSLWTRSNQLKLLDLSYNTLLVDLYVCNTQIDSLNISNNIALTSILCYSNQLVALDVSNNVALTNLECCYNQLTVLDVSNNTDLVMLECQSNQLTSLDVTNSTALSKLKCNNNQLTFLDVTYNQDLGQLNCSHNQLSILDMSFNSKLTSLACSHNKLTTLTIRNGNNANINWWSFNAVNNPDLYCIEVDDPTYSEATWDYVDSITIFSEDCGLGTTDIYENKEFQAFPNPFSDQIDLVFEKAATYDIRIFDTLGKEVYSTTVKGLRNSISTANLKQSIYFLKVESEDDFRIKKIIKR